MLRAPKAVLWGLLLAATLTFAALYDANSGERETTQADIERAMLHLCALAPRHPINRDADYRHEVARAVLQAGSMTNVPALLLVAIFYRESSLRLDRTGKLGEIGLGQTAPFARAWCEGRHYNLQTADGQAMCSAQWFARQRQACGGGIVDGLTLYASGRTCKADSEGLRRVIRDRVQLWHHLEEVTR